VRPLHWPEKATARGPAMRGMMGAASVACERGEEPPDPPRGAPLAWPPAPPPAAAYPLCLRRSVAALKSLLSEESSEMDFILAFSLGAWPRFGLCGAVHVEGRR